jgi:hypothetical protein
MSCTCGRIFDVEIGGEPKGTVYQTAPKGGGTAAAEKIGDRAALYPRRMATIVADGPPSEHVFSLVKDRLVPIGLMLSASAGARLRRSSSQHERIIRRRRRRWRCLNWSAILP